VTNGTAPALPLGTSQQSPALTQDEAGVVRSAFGALLSGLNPTTEYLTTSSSLDPTKVDEIVGAFGRTGRADLDGDGRLTGIVGLTTESTRHRTTPDGTGLFTWCAFQPLAMRMLRITDTSKCYGWCVIPSSPCADCYQTATVHPACTGDGP
jgi:hypothetical protein